MTERTLVGGADGNSNPKGTATDLAGYVGREVTLTRVEESFHIPMRVLDACRRFGRTDLLVTPVGGFGEAWVSLGRVTLSNQLPEVSEPSA